MRWLPVLILAYVAIGLQAGISGQFSIHAADPNFGLIAVVFVSINAPREAALLACVVIGGMQDLATQQPPGLYALIYGLVGWVITGVQQVVYQDHPLTHAVLTLFGGLVMTLVLYAHGRTAGQRLSLSLLLGITIYSALLAPLLVWLLNRFRPLFGFETRRRRMGY